MLQLNLYDGSRRESLLIDADRVLVGRAAECHVRLPGDATVSRVHAVIEADGGGWRISDAGSRNGTFVNGEAVDGSHSLGPADRIRIGPYVLVLQGDDDAEAETVAAELEGSTTAQLETGLTSREIEVLRLVCTGRTDQEIADELVISVKTVQSHLDRIRTKTGCRRRPELLRFAIDHGIA